MKLLIILLAMAAAGGGALHSWHSRTLYVHAALLSEAFSLSAPVKLRIADHYVRHGVMPHDNDDAGLPPPKSIYGTSVRRVAINRGGVLIVDFDEAIGAEAMTFTPTVSPVSGLLSWHCTSDSIERGVLERMRPACDYLPATLASRLMHAIANRDLALVGELLDAGAPPDAVVHGNTPLMLAAKGAGTGIVERLLAAGAHVDNDAASAERRTPLMVAITSDEPEVAALLLGRGASITRQDHRGLGALDHAVATDRRLGGERYVLMVSARFNPRFAGGTASAEAVVPEDAMRVAARRETRLAALYDELRGAAGDCHVQRLASLLREERDLGTPELVAGTPLADHIRKPRCRTTLAEHLSTKASYRLARAARLRAAVRACDTRQVRAMLRDDADLAVVGAAASDAARGGPAGPGGGAPHGERRGAEARAAEAPLRPSPFEQAVVGGCETVASLMIRERELGGRLEREILLHAIRRAPQETLVRTVGTLIAAGAEVNVRDAASRTPLAEAISLEQPVVAKYLVDAGADVDAPTANGSWPVIEASKKGYTHLVTQLIERGADIDRRDALGRTALLAAVAAGRERLVDTLVRAGADVRRRDGNGVDAVLLAESRNYRQIRTLLVASGED